MFSLFSSDCGLFSATESKSETGEEKAIVGDEEEEQELEAETLEEAYAKTLQTELKGEGASSEAVTAISAEEKRGRKRKQAEEENFEMAKMMMNKRDARLYRRIEYGVNKKQEKAQTLAARAAELEAAAAKKGKGKGKGAAAGDDVVEPAHKKQKVDDDDDEADEDDAEEVDGAESDDE